MYGRTAQGSGVEAAAGWDESAEGAAAIRAPGDGLGLGSACAGWAPAPRSINIVAKTAAERVRRIGDLTVVPPYSGAGWRQAAVDRPAWT